MGWADVANFQTDISGYARITPLTLTAAMIESGDFDDFGTDIDLLNITKESDKYPMGEDTEQQYHTQEFGARVTVEIPFDKIYLDEEGETKTKSGDDFDEINVSAVMSMATFDSVLTVRGKGCILTVGLGEKEDLSQIGQIHLMGKFTGEITEERSGGIVVVDLNFKGKKFTVFETVPPTPDVVFSDFNTAVTGGGNTIIPVGRAEVTLAAIDAADWTQILTGKIARVSA